MTPAENAAVLGTSGATTKEGGTIGNRYLLKALVASFGAQWDDEAIQRCDKSSSHRRAGHVAAAASSWVSPTFFEDGETVAEPYEWDADLDAYEEEEQERVEEADACYWNDDVWNEDLPLGDVDLEDQFGSLETAEAFTTTGMEKASSDKSAARNVMDARKLVAQVKSASGFFPVVGVGPFDGLQSMTPRASAGTKASGKGRGTSPSNTRGRGRSCTRTNPRSNLDSVVLPDGSFCVRMSNRG